MSSLQRRSLVVASTALIAALLLAWWWIAGGGGEAATPAEKPAVPAPRAADVEPSPPVSEAVASRVEVEEPAGTEASPRTAAASSVEVLVLDPGGEALPDVDVVLSGREAAALQILDMASIRSAPELERATTDGEGRARFDVPPSRTFGLTVLGDASGFARWSGECSSGDRLTVQLQDAAGVRVRVVHVDGGAPVEGARVFAYRNFNFARPVADATADAAGDAWLLGLPAGDAQVEVRSTAGFAFERVVLRAGVVEELIVEVGAGRVLRGTVVAAETGAPLADAEVDGDWTMRFPVRSGPDGSFVLRGLDSGGPVQVFARKAGYARTDVLVSADEGDVVIPLERGTACRGRVVDAAGDPVPGAYAGAFGTAHRGGQQRLDVLSARADDDGRFELRGLRTDMEHAVVVSAPGFARALRAVAPRVKPVDLGDVRLEPEAVLGGRVSTGAGGRLDAAITVTCADLGAKLSPDNARYLSRWDVFVKADGSYVLGGLPAGDYALAVRVERMERATREVSLAPAERRLDVDFVLDAGDAIAGLVVCPDGLPAPGALVLLTGVRSARSLNTRSAKDGTFRFASVPEDAYRIEVHPVRACGLCAGLRRDGVRAGTTGLLLELPAGAKIAGRVETRDGSPVEGATVAAATDDDPSLAVGSTAADGAFDLVVPADTTVDLYVQGASPSAGDGVRMMRPRRLALAGVRAGSEGVVLTLE